MKCKKCKKALTASSLQHKCERCEYRLCRECDDKSTLLNWVETNGIEEKDEYLCYKCVDKINALSSIKEADSSIIVKKSDE
jgi:hypothetical protein